MKKIALGMVLASLISGCAPRQVAEPPLTPAISPTAEAAATAYAQLALSTGQFEIQSAQLALQTSNNPAVRSFAQGVINDHAQLTAQLNSSAQDAGIALSQVVFLPEHSTLLSQLQYARGAEFDSAFRNAQIATLMQELDLYRRYAATGEIAELRTFAASAVPVIEAQLAKAQTLDASEPSYRAPNYRRSGERG